MLRKRSRVKKGKTTLSYRNVINQRKSGTSQPRTRYQKYLKTKHWRNLSMKIKRRDKFRCRLCNKGSQSGARLEVHHRTYHELGAENENDLITLCHDCHDSFHKRLQESGSAIR